MGLTSRGKIFLLTLGLLLALSQCVWAKGKITVHAVSKSQKAEISEREKGWNYTLALKMPPVQDKVSIDGRTEFYTFYWDTDGKHVGKRVTFKWYHDKNRLYVKPNQTTVYKRLKQKPAFALSVIWSAPGSWGMFKSSLGLPGAMGRSEWMKSRCYGPRVVKVFDESGELLAEKQFGIYPEGRQIY